MNYKMKYNKDALFMHRFAMKEELGELIFEVLFFVYVKSIRNDELDVFGRSASLFKVSWMFFVVGIA